MFALNLSIKGVAHAVEAIKKGHVIKVDLMKTMLDTENSFDSTPSAIESNLFYSMITISLGLPAEAAKMTTPLMKRSSARAAI